MRRIIVISVVSLLAIAGTSCSLITEFDESLIDDDAGDAEGKYSLRDNVIDPVAITLVSGQSQGVIDLAFTTAFPDVENEMLKGLLTSDVITVNVVNNATGVNYELTSGSLVESTPNDDGQYSVELNSTRDGLTIWFFNSFDNKSIHEGGDYGATLEVAENDYFKTDTIPLDVTVTSS